MTDHDRGLFRYIDGEESLNDFFCSLLARSDTSRVLNAVHPGLRFRDDAEIVATQRDGLNQHPNANSRRRTLDWVVRDEEKIIGYESKTDDSLKRDQLFEERQKLVENADGREVHLYAITEDIRRPEVTAEFDWMSWRDVGKAVNDLAEDPDQESPIIRLMADMLTSEGYDGFRGFTDYRQSEEWFIKHQNEAIDLAFDTSKYAEGLNIYDKASKNTDFHRRIRRDISMVRDNGHRALGPSYYVFTIVPEDYFEANPDYDVTEEGWDIQLTVPALHNEIFVGLNVYLSKRPELKELFRREAEELRDIVDSEEMTVKASYNSLFHNKTPGSYTKSDEVHRLFASEGGEGEYKRFRIGWPVRTDQGPTEIIEETAEKMEELHEIFYHGADRKKSFE